ncbi:MAG: response regulator transcription factor [Desulfuromonadia bacterium]
METVAVIEDERALADLLAYNLKREGLRPVVAYDGLAGLDLVQRELPSLVILDLMIPGIMGTELCRILREGRQTRAIPILMLTARGDEIDRITGFESGADDYVTKPFSMRELMLRVKALLRRSAADGETEIIRRGRLVIDPSSHRVMVDGADVTLTATEFRLLLTLAERLGRLQDREQLLRDVWGYASDVDSRTVDTHITRLRGKLGTAGSQIKTIRGFGYRLEDS